MPEIPTGLCMCLCVCRIPRHQSLSPENNQLSQHMAKAGHAIWFLTPHTVLGSGNTDSKTAPALKELAAPHDETANQELSHSIRALRETYTCLNFGPQKDSLRQGVGTVRAPGGYDI